MIRVTHSYNTVRPDTRLENRWEDIAIKAYAAEALGETAIYNKLRQFLNDEYNQWRANAEYECKKKSHKDWLGGGESYSVISTNPLETHQFYRSLFAKMPRETILQFLAQRRGNQRPYY